MTEEYLTLKQACEELQMSEAQVSALGSSGQLETKEIDGDMRFLRSSVADYKQRVESKETVVFEGEGKQKPKAEEETDYEVPSSEKAQLELEEDETDIADEAKEKTGQLDLSNIEEEPGAEESDQTSVLQPVGGGAEESPEEEEPVFQFDEDASTSFLASEAGTKEAAEGTAPPEKGEEQEGETVSLSPEDLEMEEVELSGGDEPSHTEMVADILKEETGKGEEDESLETIDLAELEGGDEASVMAEEAPAGSTDETVGMEEAKETGEEQETLLDVTAERLEEEEEGEIPTLSVGPTAAQAAGVPGEYVTVRPSALANVLLIASSVIIAFGGFLAVSGGMGIHENPVAKFVFDFIASHL